MENRSFTRAGITGTASLFHNPANPTIIHDQRIMEIATIHYRRIELLFCKPMHSGVMKMEYHCRPKMETAPLDIVPFNLAIMTPEFIEELLGKIDGLDWNKEIMILCTGTTLIDEGMPKLIGIKFKIGGTHREVVEISKNFFGSLPHLAVYEMVYRLPASQAPSEIKVA